MRIVLVERTLYIMHQVLHSVLHVPVQKAVYPNHRNARREAIANPSYNHLPEMSILRMERSNMRMPLDKLQC